MVKEYRRLDKRPVFYWSKVGPGAPMVGVNPKKPIIKTVRRYYNYPPTILILVIFTLIFVDVQSMLIIIIQ